MRTLGFAVALAALTLLGGAASVQTVAGEFFAAFSKLNHDRWYVSDGWTNGDYQSCEWRADALSTKDGRLAMRLSDHGGSLRRYGCAEVRTSARYGYGVYEARLRAASGSGLNTAFFTYIGPPLGVSAWDEIDFEFLGKDTRTVQINYFADGHGGHERMIPLGFDAAADFHDYAMAWTPAQIRWYVDGREVYETIAGAALPAAPGNLFLSLWSGAKSEDAWLGPLNYERPATAEVAWAAFTPLGAHCLFAQSITCDERPREWAAAN